MDIDVGPRACDFQVENNFTALKWFRILYSFLRLLNISPWKVQGSCLMVVLGIVGISLNLKLAISAWKKKKSRSKIPHQKTEEGGESCPLLFHIHMYKGEKVVYFYAGNIPTYSFHFFLVKYSHIFHAFVRAHHFRQGYSKNSC